ncbi:MULTISPECIES: hypothetical protein [Sphingobacterium]|jgi:hypothetical protein|uniref:Uncharacterized protein n=2 Tax=Sphingobacterium TaxID=28453 RepID=A0ABX7CSP2_SPHMU|nr:MULTISPECIES: hypothetical protein [Sphingobacterium]QQT28880.1 hypothetical protein I6I99_16130 [Sphingobacterium multivorum]QQT55091.1 hypothetical protein I6I98_07515 [Sphingobacterium multivorum]TWI25065.1 hypothetical protein IQ31_00655 [Sphingobacterium siyangense]
MNFKGIVLVISCVLIVVVLTQVYKKNVTKNYIYGVKKSYEMNDHFETDKLRKLSSRPFLFGIEDNLLSDEDYFFDENYFYAVGRRGGAGRSFRLVDIIELRRTSTQINNHYIWQVVVQLDSKGQSIFSFTHNYSLWNRNFYVFYQKIRELNPHAIKSKWSLWTM